jgi:two-component system chemotaxis response regulator CheB
VSEPKIGVLIVDDSAIVRETLTDVLSADDGIEVIATAADPYIAAMKMLDRKPDVILLDINMPRMDGLTFLKKIMSQHPIPVVICSALTQEGADETILALEYGAVDIITKPKVGAKRFLEESRIAVCDAVRGAAQAKLRAPRQISPLAVEPKLSADVLLPPPLPYASTRSRADTLIVLGASTGGTEAIASVLRAMPASSPGIVVVQHMPEHFTAAFAKRLDSLSALNVREARHLDTVKQGTALIAPGDSHVLVKRAGRGYQVELSDGPLVSRHRPSVDVLFRSAAVAAGGNAIGVIMTGMGDDGAKGMLELHGTGAYTIAQDEASSVVWGMPAEAIKLGAADVVSPLDGIPALLLERIAAGTN